VVVGLSKVETGIFNEVKIKPYIDFVKVEYVFVLGVIESKQKNNLELNFIINNANSICCLPAAVFPLLIVQTTVIPLISIGGVVPDLIYYCLYFIL